jgi:hypothetical protein
MFCQSISKEVFIGTKVRLGSEEQALCRYIAKKRSENNRACNVTNNNFTNGMSDFECDLQGFGGEMAFCKLFNSYPDLQIGARSAQTDDGDCTVSGLRIDVKTRRRHDGDLLVNSTKKPTVFAYALMTGTFPEFVFRGVFIALSLMKPERLIRMPGGMSYRAHQSELLMLSDAISAMVLCRDQEVIRDRRLVLELLHHLNHAPKTKPAEVLQIQSSFDKRTHPDLLSCH